MMDFGLHVAHVESALAAAGGFFLRGTDERAQRQKPNEQRDR